MSKEEITNLKEEFLKEIRAAEKRLNIQMTVRIKELIEKNDKYIQDFEQMTKNNKSLTDLISKKNLELHKINEFESFKKRAEIMLLTHDVRINSQTKDINDIKFTLAKEISENLTVPGFIGPTCRYKNMAQYLSTSVNDLEKIRNDNESNKRENKEIKKRIEEIIKTSLNLVDKSSEKNVEYINNKIKHSEDIINHKFVEVNEKILSFKAALLTQDKIDEFHEKIFEEINDIMYNKKEIDQLNENILKNLVLNIDNIKTEFKHVIKKNIKSKIEKLENDINEISANIQDTYMKINKLYQFQNKFYKELNTLKGTLNKNSGNNTKRKNSEENDIFDFNQKTNKTMFTSFKTLGGVKTLKNNKIEEEKINKNRIFQSFEKTKKFDSLKTIRAKSTNKIYIKDLKKSHKTYKNEINEKIKSTQNNINNDSFSEKSKEASLIFENENDKLNISIENKSNNSSKIINEIKEEKNKNINELKDEKGKDKISQEKKVKYKINAHNSNVHKFKSNLISSSNNEKENEKTKEKDKEIMLDNNKINNISKPQSNLKNKIENQKSFKKNQKIDLTNIISFGMSNNEKISILPLEKNIKKNNEEFNTILNVFQETNSSIKQNIYNNPINTINNIKRETKKTEGLYSLYKLASIDSKEKTEDNFGYNKHLGKLSKKTNSLVKPFRKEYSPLYQSYDSKLNYNINKYNTNNYIIDKKITSAFGRTSYSIYNKKEEGIQNLINKKINSSKNKEYLNKAGDFNVELTPVAKIKIFEN